MLLWTKPQYRFILVLIPTLILYFTSISHPKLDLDHGENGLPTILRITVTRRILIIPAALIFIPWSLGSNQYLTCHQNYKTEIFLAS